MYEMKESCIEWIGQIPKHWEVRRMKYCFNSHVVGSWGQEQLYNNNDIICIRVADFAFDKMSIATKAIDEYTKRNYSNHIISKLILHQNDILIEKSGGGDNTPVGRCIIVDIDYMAVYSNFIERLRVISLAYPKYMQYILFSFYKSNCIYNYIKQTIGIQNLDISMMFNVEKVIFPPLDEQKKIADFLDNKVSKIDDLISDTKKLIDKYKEYKQSLITEIVTKGLNHNVEMKESGIEWIGQISKHWEVNKLKNLFLFGKGLSITKDDLKDNGLAVISYGQVHSKLNKGIVNNNLIRYVDEIYLKIGVKSLVKKGDFIFADTSEDYEGCGNSVYIDKNIILFAGYHTIILKTRKYKNNKYLSYLFQIDTWRKQIRSKVFGIKLFSITQKILKEVSAIIPPIDEQKEIVKYLDDKCQQIESIIEEKQALIEKLEEYKKSLIYEYVTGKKQVENE